VCDPTCNFSILEQKIQMEEDIKRPVNSNDWVQDALKKIDGLFYQASPVLQKDIKERFCPFC
jgi:hypothetical protein